MNSPFELVHNHHERIVFEAIGQHAVHHPHLADNEDLLSDVACVALNRLPARYIRHEVDFSFYLSDKERADGDLAVREAVKFAFEFVQARTAMRARA